VPEPRAYRLIVPGAHPLSANARRRAPHWGVVARDNAQWRSAVAWQARAAHQGPPLERAHVRITLWRRGGPARDPDGAVSSCKAVIDGLTIAGGGRMIVGDAPHQIALEVCQRVGAWRGVEIEVWEGGGDAVVAEPAG
jgi:hypothetical protein